MISNNINLEENEERTGLLLKKALFSGVIDSLEEWNSVAEWKKSFVKSYQMHRSHSGLLCRSKLHPDCRHGMKHKRLSVLCLLNETKVKSCLEIQLDFILKHDLCFLG